MAQHFTLDIIDGLEKRIADLQGVLQIVDKHLDVMMGDGSGMPFQTFLTQTALLRGQVKDALANVTPPTRTWTSAKPTEPGWYWTRFKPGCAEVIIFWPTEKPEGEFYGPLDSPPQE